MYKAKDVGSMIISPLVAMWINNHLWVVYAYPKGNIFPLFSVCVFAEALSIVYIAIYTRCCENRLYVAKAVGLGLLIFIPVTLYLILTEAGVIHQSRSGVVNVLGYLAVAMNFVLYLSPLEKVKHVIMTKSSASIPVLMCSAIGLNSFLWFISGVVEDDMYLLVPNAIGTVLSIVQVALYFVYRPRQSERLTKVADLEVDLPLEAGFHVVSSPVVAASAR